MICGVGGEQKKVNTWTCTNTYMQACAQFWIGFPTTFPAGLATCKRVGRLKDVHGPIEAWPQPRSMRSREKGLN